MTLKTSRRGRIPPFIAMDVLREANARERRGEPILHLEVGEPGEKAPQAALDAAAQVLARGRIGYTDATGIGSLRNAIAAHYERYYGLSLDPARVVVTTGSSGGFLLSFLAAFDAGDRVALALPCYPAYRNILVGLDIEPVLLTCGPEARYQPNVAVLESSKEKIDGLILASPANPTGTMLPREDLKALLDYCRDRGIRVISDEIYHGINFSMDCVTAAEFCPQSVIINSFSKYYCMTGWRIGWAVVPEDLLRQVECLAQNFFISAPEVSQHAALAALACRETLDARVARYAAARAHLLTELPRMGITRLAPVDGAFYVYADIGHLTDDSEAFCRQLLAETGIATTPGVDFDPKDGRHYVRLSFAGPESDIVAALERLRAFL